MHKQLDREIKLIFLSVAVKCGCEMTLYLAFADVYLYVCVYTLVTIVNGVCTLYFAGVYEYQG